MNPESYDGRRAAVERAFVACRYALGARRSLLLKGLCNPSSDACHLADALSQNERNRRAMALAEGLKPIVEALTRVTFEWR